MESNYQEINNQKEGLFNPSKKTAENLTKILLENFRFVCDRYIHYHGLWFYTDKYGSTNDPKIIQEEIEHLFEESLSTYKLREIYKLLSFYAPMKKEADRKLIQFKNGILNTETKEFSPLDDSLFIKSVVPWRYNPSAQPVEIVDKALNDWSCGDADTRQLMLEWAGYNLFRWTPIHSFMLIMGADFSGKETYCGLLEHLIGSHNVSFVHMKDLDKRFSPSEFFDKSINLSNESEEPESEESYILRAVAAEDSIHVEPRRKEGFSYTPSTKMTFYSNKDFIIKDKSESWKYRMHVLRFNADFSSSEKCDPHFLEKLIQPYAMEYFIKLAIEAALKAVEHYQFTLPKQSKEWIEKHDKK